MWVKTGVTKTAPSRACTFKSLLDGGGYGSYGVASTDYTGALSDRHLSRSTFRFQGARVFTNKPPCGPKRGHGTPSRGSRSRCTSTSSPSSSAWIRRAPSQHLVPANSLTANWLRIGSMGLGSCIEKVIRGSGWKERFKQLPYGKGIGLARARRTSPARDCRSTGTRCRTRSCSSSCDRGGGGHGVLRLDRDRAGLGLDPRHDRRGGARPPPARTSPWSPATPISRRWTWAATPAGSRS